MQLPFTNDMPHRTPAMKSARQSAALVIATVAFASAPLWARAQALAPHQQLAKDIYKELVEINTVTATGDTLKAAEAMAARLKAAGFPDADVRVLSPAPRKGNLVARLRGTAKRKPILLLAHLGVERGERLAGVVPVDVAEGDDVLAGEVDQVGAPLPADADCGDVEEIARRREAAAEHVPRNDREPGRGGGDVAHEAAPRHLCHLCLQLS
jgi:hypothetical protein